MIHVSRLLRGRPFICQQCRWFLNSNDPITYADRVVHSVRAGFSSTLWPRQEVLPVEANDTTPAALLISNQGKSNDNQGKSEDPPKDSENVPQQPWIRRLPSKESGVHRAERPEIRGRPGDGPMYISPKGRPRLSNENRGSPNAENSTTPYRAPRSSAHTTWQRLNLHRRDRLGMKALGEEAEIITLEDQDREPGGQVFFMRNMEDFRQITATKTSGDPTKLLEGATNIQVEEQALDKQGVKEALTGIRNSMMGTSNEAGQNTIDTSALRRMRRQLHDGFTHEQLVTYFNEKTSQDASAAEKSLTTPELSVHRFMRSSWTRSDREKEFPQSPGAVKTLKKDIKASLAKHQNNPGQAYRGRTFTNKLSVIHAIIHERWRLQTEDRTITQGSYDVVFLSNAHSKFLLELRQDVLEQIPKFHKVQIQASLPLRCLRISGEQSACSDAFLDINSFLDTIHSASVEVLAEHSSPKMDERLKNFGQQTGTLIGLPSKEPAKGSISLLIYFVKGNEQGLEDVKRLIARDYVALPSGNLGFHPPQISGHDLAMLPMHPRGPALARYVHAEWSRMTSPFARTTSLMDVKAITERCEQAIAAQTDFMEYENEQRIAGYRYLPPINTEISCSFGHLLQSSCPAPNIAAPVPGSLESSAKRSFFPGGLSVQSLMEKGFLDGGSVADRIVISLVPKAAIWPRRTEQHSLLRRLVLELTLDIDRELGSSSLSRARLVFDTRVDHIPLPQLSTDIALQSKHYITLGEDPLGTDAAAPLKAFLGASQLNTRVDEPLKTPTFLDMNVPRVFVKPPLDEPSEKPPETPPTVPLTFTFWSLQHLSTFTKQRSNVQVIGRTVEAGRREGKWEECELICPPSRLISSGDLEEQIKPSRHRHKQGRKKPDQVQARGYGKRKEQLTHLVHVAADVLMATAQS